MLWSYLQGMETWKQYLPHYRILLSFDPTYKGWKRVRVYYPCPPFHRFDPTYKGWKPRDPSVNAAAVSLLWSYLQGMETKILWNISCEQLQLWSYLQGMETLFQLLYYSVPVPTLWSYLQGMETTPPLWGSGHKQYGFDPTYKGWKLLSRSSWGCNGNCFDPTYKGWKLD